MYLCEQELILTIDGERKQQPGTQDRRGVQFLFRGIRGYGFWFPLLVGLDPSTALFTAGVGTLIFSFGNAGMVPIFWAAVSLLSLPS